MYRHYLQKLILTFAIGFFINQNIVLALDQSFAIIDSITIVGNVRTKNWVIKQEARLHENDTIWMKELAQRIEEIEIDLIKTNLFSTVDVSYHLQYEDDKFKIKINILVDEHWLLFPALILDIADRNFNVWWKEQKMSIKRINIGAKLFHYNFTGRNDRLRLAFHTGYTNKYELSYEYPYLSKKHQLGLKVFGLYASNKEINYQTVNNKSLFFKIENEPVLQRLNYGLQLKYRPNRKQSHHLLLEQKSIHINDTIARLNPDYFLDSRIVQSYTKISYGLRYSSTDQTIRRNKGINLAIDIDKIGIPLIIPVNYLDAREYVDWTKPIASKLVQTISIHAKQAIIRNKKYPYNLYTGFGYREDFVYGYEYYIIDALDYIIINEALRFPLFSFKHSGKKILAKEPKLKLKLNTDLIAQLSWAYSNDPYTYTNNQLANRPLYSISMGIATLVNDGIQIILQSSINHKSEIGIFLHTKSAF